jgi:hypothetical protein
VGLTQRDVSPAPRKVARSMFRFLHRSKPTSAVSAVSAPPAPSTPLVRQPADRAAHLDDQHLVFWNSGVSRASAEQLSEAAASWHQAVRNNPVIATPELPRIARV